MLVLGAVDLPWACAGTVSGVQASLQSSFEIGSFIAGTILRSPKDFHWLMAGSCAAVATAAATFYAFASRVGKGRAVYKTSVQEYDR